MLFHFLFIIAPVKNIPIIKKINLSIITSLSNLSSQALTIARSRDLPLSFRFRVSMINTECQLIVFCFFGKKLMGVEKGLSPPCSKSTGDFL